MNEFLRQEKPLIAIIDNSISFTGAFKCALTEALLLRDKFDFVFILPLSSTVLETIAAQQFRYYTLPMLEINRSPKSLLLYGPKLFQNAMRLSAILKKENAAAVQVNDFYNLLGVATKLLRFQGKLVTYVRFLPVVVPTPLRRLWISLALRYSDAVVAVSDAVLKQLPPHRKNIRIYDAVVLQEHISSKAGEADQKQVLFLYLANYIQGKGQEHALRAFDAVVKQRKKVVLKFVGGDMGLSKNKAFKAALQQYVLQNGLTEYVVFEAFLSNIEQAIKEADVVLNFSEAESFSMTCAEASYYGVPVIATRCGGPEEIIVHQQTGLLVENRNVDEMQAAMLMLTDFPELRARYGTAARAYVQQKFSSEQYIRHFTALLKKVGILNET